MRELFHQIFETPDTVKEYINLMVTEQEQKLVVHLNNNPSSVEEIALFLDMEFKEAEKLVANAYHRCVIDKYEKSEKIANEYTTTDKYIASTLYMRLGYFTQYEQELWQSIPQKDREKIEEWYINEYTSRLSKTLKEQKGELAGRQEYVLPVKQAIAAIEQANISFYVVPCNCRTTKNSCSFSVQTCLHSDYGPNTQWDRGYGEALTLNEVKSLLLKLDMEGLIHSVTRDGDHVCNCETCCCYSFRAAQNLGIKGQQPRCVYVAKWNSEKCIHCGICAKRCHFGAFTKKTSSKEVTYDSVKCWGCGVCESTCPKGAIKMIKIEI